MLRLEILEKMVRFFASFSYRFILIIYSWVLFFYYDHYFSTSLYIVASSLYLSVFLYLFLKKHSLHHIRMILDFVFILMNAYGKPIVALPVVLYVLLPTINSPNHTGNKRNISLYIYTLVAITLLGGIQEGYHCVAPIIAYSIIGWFEFTRRRISLLTSELTNVLDDSYYKNLQVGKTHRIYKDIIGKLNSSSLATFSKIVDIYCLVAKDKRLQIVNSSSYAYILEFVDELQFIENITKREIITDVSISVDGRKIEKNICVRISFGDNTYIFVFHLDDKSWDLIAYILAEYILKVVFTRVVMVLEVEYQIKEMKKTYFEKLKNNMFYFECAIDAMHFLNNKFSPMKTLLQLFDKYNESTRIDDRKDLMELIKFTHERAKQSFTAIERRANQLLSNKNELLYRDLQPYSINKLFYMIRTNWREYFDEYSFDIGWDIDTHGKRILLNEDGIYYVITNILDNMKKHSNQFRKVSFTVEQSNYIVIFENDYKENKELIMQLCDEFMSEDTQEISMRKTHGLATIKKILNQMSISYKMEALGEKLYLTLLFKEVANEATADF